MKKNKKSLAILFLTLFSLVLLSGCLKKEQAAKKEVFKPIELVYYKLFDQEDVMAPMIQQYQAAHPNVIIKYRKFDTSVDYYRTILNELAEGEGPDIFSVPNYWLMANAKKITPIDPTVMSVKTFEDSFVSVAAKDAVFVDPKDGVNKVFGLPLTVDTLALYYNKDLFEDKVPSRGRPGQTWEEFKDDVFKLTKADNSFERFELAGTAMGRSDNISRSLDILLSIMLQNKAQFYNDQLTVFQLTKQQSTSEAGLAINPATEAMKLYTSFSLASQKNYSWNEYMSDANSDVKELEAFARGKVASIFGYSYTYQQIMDEIEQLKKKNVPTIKPEVIKVNPIPQVNNPDKSTEKRDVLASYFVETVGRNCEHPAEAWDFLMFINSPENQKYYNQKTHRPTSRRDLIESQKQDAIYGVFAEQVGYAESLPIYDYDLFKKSMDESVMSVINTTPAKDALQKAEEQIKAGLPSSGILPTPTILPVKSGQTAANSKTATK